MPSPYPLHYTLRWPFYYCFPSNKKHTHFEKMSLTQLPPNGVENTLQLILCGDMMVLQNDILPTLHKEVSAFINSADAMIGNCEAPIGYHAMNPAAKYGMKFDMPLDYLMGVIRQTQLPPNQWYLSMANNHVSDWGYERMIKTQEILHKKGINPIGILEKNGSPLNIFTINEYRIGIIAWTDWVNCKIQSDEALFFAQRDHIKNTDWQSVRELYALDFLIALPHWEYEFQQYPKKSTRDFAKELFQNNGFDLLVGAHTHMLQPFEKLGRGYCFYNLGNFFGLGAAWPVRMAPLLKIFMDKTTKKITGYDLKIFAQVNQKNRIDILPLSQAPNTLRTKINARLNELFQC